MTSGFAIVEALVAVLLTAIALAALTAGAGAGARPRPGSTGVRLAVALATDRLDMLRAGPRDAGTEDVAVGGTVFVRTWRAEGGRGAPVQLHVEVEWPAGHVTLESEVFP